MNGLLKEGESLMRRVKYQINDGKLQLTEMVPRTTEIVVDEVTGSTMANRRGYGEVKFVSNGQNFTLELGSHQKSYESNSNFIEDIKAIVNPSIGGGRKKSKKKRSKRKKSKKKRSKKRRSKRKSKKR